MRKPRADQRRYHFIYKTTCFVTNRYYIGLHSADKLDDSYLGGGQRLSKSIAKHGRENHRREILEFLPDRKTLCEREAELVNETTLRDPMCMNIIPGGGERVGFTGHHTEETKRKLSIINLGKQKSKTTKQRISEARKGMKFSDEHKLNIAIAVAATTRLPCSETTREKISQALRGRSLTLMTPELKEKITVALTGRKHSPETRKKISEARRKQTGKLR